MTRRNSVATFSAAARQLFKLHFPDMAGDDAASDELLESLRSRVVRSILFTGINPEDIARLELSRVVRENQLTKERSRLVNYCRQAIDFVNELNISKTYDSFSSTIAAQVDPF